jgi:hypothetical protein
MFRPGPAGLDASHYEHPCMAASDLRLDHILNRISVVLTTFGMAASTVALWFYVQALPTFKQRGYVFDFGFGNVVKSPLYYPAHGLEIFFVCGAGLISLSIAHQRLLRRYGLRFLLFLFATALMAIRGYSWSTALSAQIFSSSGPFICIVSVLMFVGAQPGNWRILDKLFLWTAITYSAFVAVGILGVHSANRWEAILAFESYLNVLYWPAVWILLRPGSSRSLAGRLRYAPLAVYAVGSIVTQTRLNWVMIFGALSAYVYIQRRRHSPLAPRLILAAGLGLSLILFSMGYLSDAKYMQTLQASADAFFNRMDQDTRTGQLIEFFRDVHISELLLGRGSLATWNWNGSEYTSGVDVGYLSLLFFGGIPLLITYILVHFAPACGAISRPQSEWQRSCAAIALLWALRMFSQNFPSLTAEYYPVLLCMGGCLGQAHRLSIYRARRIGAVGAALRSSDSPIF